MNQARPGPAGPYPAAQPGQQYQHQQPYHQQQYQQPYAQQGAGWGPPQPPRKRKTGLLIVMLALGLVIVLGLGFGAYWVFIRKDDSGKPPAVDASQDLKKAPIGCALFDKSELARYIPGRVDLEPGAANTNAEYLEQGQCSWNNSDTFIKDKVRPAHVIVTSYIYRATRTKSGVDAAKEHMKRRVRNGVTVNVKDAEEALLVAQEKSDSFAAVTARYRNIVYHVDYGNQTDGAPVKSSATEVATAAIGKVPKG